MSFEIISEEIRARLDKIGTRLRIRPIFRKIESRCLFVLRAFYVYLAFVGIFAFSLFIAQEATQIVIWANFNGLSERRYHLVKDNLDFLEDINDTGKFINTYFMWINPVQRWSYNAFHRGTDQYIATIQAAVLAHEPELYIGRELDFQFKYQSSHRLDTGDWELRNRDMSVRVPGRPEGNYVTVRGTLQRSPEGRLFVDLGSGRDGDTR
jgi:hypothetical protein